MILLLLACNGNDPKDSFSGDGSISNLTATVSDTITTVVTLSWTTETDTRGMAHYGDGLVTPLEDSAGKEHSMVLLGLKPGTDYEALVMLEDGTESDPISFRTGDLPTELPEISVTGGGNDVYQVTTLLGGMTGPVILDPDGTVVWYWIDTRGLDTYRARLSVDGQSVLYNAASVSGDPADNAELVRVALDGSGETPIPVPLLAHDFVEHPDGTLAAIVTDYQDVDGEQIRGDKIVEIAPDGTQTDLWSAFDCFDPTVIQGDDSDYGWTFANAIDYDADAGVYYLGIRNFSSIVKIDRATGNCDWVFGGAAATFEPTSDAFLHQHQFELLEDSILIFDNEGADSMTSRAVEYSFDPDGGTASPIWSYEPDPGVFTFVLGDVHRLANGDTMVDFAVGGQIDRVTPEGEVTFRVNTAMGYAFGFNTVVEGLY